MEQLGKNRITDRSVFIVELPSLNVLPETLNLPAQYFGLFLACDARQVPDDEINHIAYSLIREGMSYVCTWGPDCERVNDLFDSVLVELNADVTVESVITTTWLDEDSLGEALWHFLNVAFPADDYWDGCKAELFVVVDNQEWSSQIRARLKDQGGLSKDVVGEEDDKEGVV
jgi:hypothetical protein